MKKFLLGTTAFVAAGAAASGAFAADPLKVGIGGYWAGAMGQVVSRTACNNTSASTIAGTCNLHSQATVEDSRVFLNGSMKLDNGLTFGYTTQWEYGGGTGFINKNNFVKFGSDYGEIRFGNFKDTRTIMGLQAPMAGGLFGVNTPVAAFTNNPVGTISTYLPIGTSRATKIAYFSPKLAGFQLGLSYSPTKNNITADASATSATFPKNNRAGKLSQEWSTTVNYDNKFGAFGLQAYIGVTGAHMEAPIAGTPSVENPLVISGGAVLSYGPFQFGGSAVNAHNANSNTAAAGGGANSTTAFDLGALYTVGPFSVSLDWARLEGKGLAGGGGQFGGVCTGTAAICGATGKLNVEELIVDYVLGPGLSVGATLQLNQYSPGTGLNTAAFSGNTYHDTVIAVGTMVTF